MDFINIVRKRIQVMNSQAEKICMGRYVKLDLTSHKKNHSFAVNTDKMFLINFNSLEIEKPKLCQEYISI